MTLISSKHLTNSYPRLVYHVIQHREVLRFDEPGQEDFTVTTGGEEPGETCDVDRVWKHSCYSSEQIIRQMVQKSNLGVKLFLGPQGQRKQFLQAKDSRSYGFKILSQLSKIQCILDKF
jgi:hypothetical protein